MHPPLHCLLIDDDIDDCEIWSLTISSIDPHTRADTITESIEALSRLGKADYKPDLIFLDLNMPKLDGMDCLRRIRQMEQHRDTPVIIYSTSTNPRDKEQCSRLGASDYLIKPASIETLRKELSSILARHQTKTIAV